MYTDGYNLLISRRSPNDPEPNARSRLLHGPACALSLDDRTHDHLGKRLSALSYPAGNDYERFVRLSRQWVASSLPEPMLLALEDLRTSPMPAGALLLRNLPTDPSPRATAAADNGSHAKRGHVSESLLTGIGALLGEPYVIAASPRGLVQNLGMDGNAESAEGLLPSTAVALRTEQAALEQRPRWTLTSLLPGGSRSTTLRIADLRDALPLLDTQLHRQLAEPRYLTRELAPGSGSAETCETPATPHAVISADERSPELRVDFHRRQTQGVDTLADHALIALQQALASVARDVTLQPGMLLVVSNRLVVTGQVAGIPHQNEGTPWLQRLDVTDSLWLMREWQRESRRVLVR